jgi:cytidine deaminase
MSDSELLKVAEDARARAYAKYSDFRVGAALLTKSGKVFSGCNVENISLGLTMCAERVAVGAAIADGEVEFVAVAIVADSTVPILPCGACRQVMAEFNPNLRIVTSTTSGQRETVKLSEILPRPSQGILDRPGNV